MNKFCAVYILMSVFLIKVCAQDVPIPTIAGVKFGWSLSYCKSILDKRFNAGEDSYQFGKDELKYHDVRFADEYFSCVTFSFQNDGERTFLYHISFSCAYNLDESDMAKNKRDRLFDLYSEKYNYRWEGKDEDGFKYYVLGNNPSNKRDGLIIISTSKGKNKKGETKLWTDVDYGPVPFIKAANEI